MDPLVEVLLCALIPAAVAFGAAWLAVLWRKGDSVRAIRLGAGLGLAGGFFAAFAFLDWAPLKPEDSWNWLPYLALLAVGAGFTEELANVPVSVRWCLRGMVAAAAAWLLLPDWPELQANRVAWLAAIGLAVLVLWSLLELVAQRQPGPGLPLLLLALSLAAAALLFLAGNLKLALLPMALAAGLGGLTLVACIYSDKALLPGAVPGFTVLFVGLVFTARFHNYAEPPVPAASFVLVGAAPAVLLLGLLPQVAQLRASRRFAVQAVALLLPVALGLALAALPALGTADPGTEAALALFGWRAKDLCEVHHAVRTAGDADADILGAFLEDVVAMA